MSSPAAEFENILNNIQGNTDKNKQCGYKKDVKNTLSLKSSELFTSLISENDALNESMVQITNDISLIREKNVDSFEKNITFSLAFRALDVSVKEYTYQSHLFLEYTHLYDEMCNEENIVKILDLLRLIITDRRAILNDIINNILKIQKLDNDRIKMDSAVLDEDDLVGDMLSPDTL